MSDSWTPQNLVIDGKGNLYDVPAEALSSYQVSKDRISSFVESHKGQGEEVSGYYMVRSGDTLSGIAQRYYGDASLWPIIWANNFSTIGSNPNYILPSERLIL